MDIAVWVIVAVVVVVGVAFALFGWDRYRGQRRATTSGAQPTGEVFTDPSTGETMRVWYDPATGKREYRPD